MQGGLNSKRENFVPKILLHYNGIKIDILRNPYLPVPFIANSGYLDLFPAHFCTRILTRRPSGFFTQQSCIGKGDVYN